MKSSILLNSIYYTMMYKIKCSLILFFPFLKRATFTDVVVAEGEDRFGIKDWVFSQFERKFVYNGKND